MLKYDLADMKGKDGASLRFEVDYESSKYAIKILDIIKDSPAFKELTLKLPSPRLILYFQHIIRKEIYPFIRQVCVIRWYRRNNRQISPEESVILIPRSGILQKLAECWDFENIPVKLISPFANKEGRLFVGIAKKCIKGMFEHFHSAKKRENLPLPSKSTIACHYVEGIDLSRRNDLNWYPESGIKPERILIYFDSLENKTSKPIRKEVIEYFENEGIRWVSLKKGIIEGQPHNYWRAPSLPRDLFVKKKRVYTSVERWVIDKGNELLREVYYWRAFYERFNIYINYIPEEGNEKNIIQAIAFDIVGEKRGFLIGKQRSEIYANLSLYIGHHPKHIFFMWSKRLKDNFEASYEQTERLVVNGYPNNVFKKPNIPEADSIEGLRAGGVNFIIALFDSVHGPEIHFSTKKMMEFYEAFFSWLFEDSTVGLVIKSKKPAVFKSMPSIHPLLDRAIATGRCIKVENEWGRFPSDVSFSADMAVGVGISTPVTEAVIGGCRGIHYDITRIRDHKFYKWGDEKLIFDNLDRMMTALKAYKNTPKGISNLGDWSSFIDELEPFRDGKGGMRMGTYMRWLLESFDVGKSRKESMEYADKSYAGKWGADKIIDLENI